MTAPADPVIRDVIRRLETVAREQGGSRVTRIRVRIRPSSGLSPEDFRTRFARSARATLAEGAEVQVQTDGDADAGTEEVFLETVEIELE